MAAICYRNNPKSLFRKYAYLVTWFANQGIGRDYLGLPKTKIALMLPNGYCEDGGKGYFRSTFTTRAVYAPKLYPTLEAIDRVAMWLKDFDEAKRLLAWSLGLSRKKPDIASAVMFTTTTKNPDANPETTTVDGTVGKDAAQQTFTNLRNSAGDQMHDSTNYINCGNISSGGSSNQWTGLYRGITLFDTSSITDTDSIDSGSETLVSNGNKNANFSQSIVLVQSSPASNTGLANSDFNIGNWPTFTRQATADITVASWAASGGNNVFTLGATGLGNISKTGITKFGTLTSCDMDNSAPTWASSQTGYAECRSADFGSLKPLLTVIHSVAVVSNSPSGHMTTNTKFFG